MSNRLQKTKHALNIQLKEACLSKDFDIAQELLVQGADILSLRIDEFISQDNLNVIKFIFDYIPSNMKNKIASQHFESSIFNGKTEIGLFLLTKIDKLTVFQKQNFCIGAVQNNELTMLSKIIEHTSHISIDYAELLKNSVSNDITLFQHIFTQYKEKFTKQAIFNACKTALFDHNEKLFYYIDSLIKFTEYQSYRLLEAHLSADTYSQEQAEAKLNIYKYFILEKKLNINYILEEKLTNLDEKILVWSQQYKLSTDLKNKLDNDFTEKPPSNNKLKL